MVRSEGSFSCNEIFFLFNMFTATYMHLAFISVLNISVLFSIKETDESNNLQVAERFYSL